MRLELVEHTLELVAAMEALVVQVVHLRNQVVVAGLVAILATAGLVARTQVQVLMAQAAAVVAVAVETTVASAQQAVAA
jgi:hypothetical protein